MCQLCHVCREKPIGKELYGMVWKMSYLLYPLLLCLDVCVVHTIGIAQFSPLLIHRPFISLWVGGLVRAGILLFLILTYPGSPPWINGSEGLQSIGVLCFLCPVYTSLLWVLGQSTLDQLWGWCSWERLLQNYVITVVAWLYWSGYIGPLLTKMTREKPKESSGASLKRLMGYMLPYSSHFVVVLILVALSSWGEMAIPQYTGRMADWIMNEETPDAFTSAITVMTLITVASAVFEFACDLRYNITMSRIHTSVQGIVFQSVLKQEIAFFDASNSGEIVSRITSDANKMSETLSEDLSLLMWYFARVIFVFFYMVCQSWKLSLLTCMGLPIIWIIPKFFGSFDQKLSAEVQESLAKANQVATEVFSSIKTVRSFANEDGETERYRKRLDDTFDLNKKEAAAYAYSSWANSMSGLGLKVFILYYGGLLVTRGTVSSGNLVSFILYELQFASAMESVMRCYPNVKKAIGASEKIFEYLDRKPQVPPEGTLEPEHLNGHVQFKNVTFAYAGKKDATLKGVCLEMKPGQVTALVGLNSSGKTTCLRLLERFYQPQTGEILLDGKPLQCYKDQYLREKIAVVSQECVLFARSVKENIEYGYKDASDEKMRWAAELASAHTFISELPNGYETDAGQKGGQVSGGQKQRIAIARALIRKPKILILDNATSDLDTETEHNVHEALLNKTDQWSVLLISHKMSVVQKANNIIVLDNGMVVEEGSHDELLKKDGFYADMVRKQNVSSQLKEEEGTK